MSEWKKVRLGEVADVKGGKRLPAGMMLTEEQTNHPYIRIRDLTDVKNLEITTAFQYVTDDVQQRISRYIVDEGDVLISIVGTVGLVSIVGRSLTGANLTENCVKIISLRGLDNNYLYYYLKSASGQYQIRNLTVGAVQPKLPITNILSIQLSLPPLPTQRKIAAVLGALDDKIENNRKICANLEAQAQAIFKSWFVDFEPFGGKMPSGWKLGKLGDIIESMLNGDWGKDTPDDKNDSPVYCVRGADIPDVVCGNKGKMPLRYILPKNYETKQLANGDVVIEISGGSPTQSTGRAALITDSLLERYDRGMVCTNFCKAVKPRDGFSFLFYNYWCYLYNKGVFFQYENGTTGIKNLDIRTALNELDVVLPVAGALSKFTDIVSTNFKLICKLGLETEKLAATRDALLPKLMSGEIDVEKVEVQEVVK